MPQWDDLHAAVHEEVERLPAALRAVFVLCELEGVRQPDAAAKLGCKLGTLSGRLTRARQALLKALTARGLAPVLSVSSVAFGNSAAAVPLVLVAKAVLYARGGIDAGLAVPSGVWKLAQSATEGTLMKTKLMVAAGIAAAGLMLTAVGGWVPLADAQDPPPARDPVRAAPQPVPLPAPRVARPPTEPPARAEDPDEPPVAPQPPRPPVAPRAPRVADPFDPTGPDRGPPPSDVAAMRPQPQRVEHRFRDSVGTKDELHQLLLDEQAAGWEFAGEARVGRGTVLVFKRPKGNPVGAWGTPATGGWGGPMAPTAPRPPAVPVTPRGPVDPAQPPRGAAPRPANPLVAPPRRGDPGLPMAVPPGDNRLPPRASDELFPQPPVIREVPSPLLPPRRNESVPEQYAVPSPSFPSPVLSGEPVRMIPPAIEANPVEIHVLELKNATPAAMALHVKKFFDKAEVSIDEDSGALVIRCGKKMLEDIKKLVEKLDKPSKRGGA